MHGGVALRCRKLADEDVGAESLQLAISKNVITGLCEYTMKFTAVCGGDDYEMMRM